MRSYIIKNKFYGKALIGTTVHYQGYRARPRVLKDKGQGFTNGKHLLETIGKKFKRFELILTPKKDLVQKSGSKYLVFLSEKTLKE